MGLGPTARRRRLGAHLSELREKAGLTVSGVGEHMGASPQTIRNWEKGQASMKKMELAALLELYDAPHEVRQTLEDARREGSKRSWWSTYRLPEWFKPYVGLETDAALVCNFEQELIPGLLQTEDYARAIHTSGGHITDPEDVEKRVAARMERQRRLFDKDNPLELRAVISEAALQRKVGGRKVWSEQLEHLLTMADLPNVMFQVVSYEAGEHASMTSGFTVLEFSEPADPDVAYMESPLGGHVIEDNSDVTLLRNLFDELRSSAMPQRESVDLVREIAPGQPLTA
ncbi:MULTISPECIES: helix-turn-helix domain-containing protein [Actinopolyspora]|nr:MULTISPECIES: helix-turn-helix transcriptional regulator [Actinopolyspora]NHD16022.1 helix-turn-helix domain-containing protein [Actinopolyspora sp. BKK2]NHE74764.1 helix-turn-helix domain-containing protein [Actinopolyspora sp. BKK1]